MYFIRNNGEGLIRAKGIVQQVVNSEKMNKEESIKMVDDHANGLQLTNREYKKWAGKRYLVLIMVKDLMEVEPFKINRSKYGNMDDWLPVNDINIVIDYKRS